MELHIGGKWHLRCNDSMNITLIEKKINQDKRSQNYGKETETERGYYQTLEQVLHAAVKKGILDSEAESLIELTKDVEEINKLIREFCKEHNQGFNEFVKTVRMGEKNPEITDSEVE